MATTSVPAVISTVPATTSNLSSIAAITDNGGSTDASGFCLMCGFDFGHIVAGVDNRVMGLLLLMAVIFLVCMPCIVMSICYLCAKRKKKKYTKVVEDDGDDDDDGK